MKRFLLFLILISLFYSCREEKPDALESRDEFKVINEREIIQIKLEGEASSKDAEFSGLSWHKDKLILLPQFPYLLGDGINGAVFYIPKSEISEYLNSENPLPIQPRKIKFNASGLERFNKWGSGYEAIAFKDDTVFVAIESYEGETKGYLVRGLINDTKLVIDLDSKSLTENEFKDRFENHAEEAITIFKDKVIAIHETNGQKLFPLGYAHARNTSFTINWHFTFPNIEYRITDATSVSSDSTFWVINYFWLGDQTKLNISRDQLFSKYGIGDSHKYNYSVERLLQLKIKDGRINLVDRPPIYLELPEGQYSRNWEGIAEFDTTGFLLATDKYPYTILAFVPSAEN